MRVLWMTWGVLLALACQQKPPRPSPQAGGTTAPPGMSASRTDSAAFHLEVAAVHERYQDRAGALEHASKAIPLAGDARQRATALEAVARLKEQAGDMKGAREALEKAWAELEPAGAKPPTGAGASPGATPGASGDVLIQLVRLRSADGQDAQALQLCQQGIARAREPWRREALEALEVGLLRKTGGLEARLAQAEKALDGASSDEAALRFLVVAVDGAAPSTPAAPMPAQAALPPPAAKPPPEQLIRALQRLSELHPDDLQLRQRLQSALERAGRIEYAVKLAQTTSTAAGPECFRPLEIGATLAGAAEVARIRARAGQKDKALGEAARIASLEPREGLAALLVAADVYREQGALPRAAEVLQKAEARARYASERRDVAYARERLAQAKGDGAALAALYAGWERGPDPCLRHAAQQRMAQRAVAVERPGLPPPMPPPLPTPPPDRAVRPGG